MNKSEALALIEAVKELARAVEALTVTCEQLQPRKNYQCVVCGREDVPGVLSSEGFTCEDCFQLVIQAARMRYNASDIEAAIKEAAKRINSTAVTFENFGIAGNDVFAYTCGDCGEKEKSGVDFGVGGFFCDGCMKKYMEKSEDVK